MAQRKDEQDRGVDGTNSRRAAAWLAWSLVALSVALLVGGLVLSRAASSAVPDLSFGETDDASVVANLITLLPFSVVGAIIASRHPRNAIGWLFCSVGVTVGLNSFAGDYTEFWLASGFGMSSLGETAARMFVGPLLTYAVLDGLLAEGPPRPPAQEKIEEIVDLYMKAIT
jgi:hypothetical protein